MASYLNFYLDLEATAEVIVPQYTTNEALTHIRIISDSILDEIYNIKIVDSLGIEHVFPTNHTDTDNYDLEVVLNDYPLGITTFYASIKDQVGNTKDLVPTIFEIYKATLLFVEVSDSQDYKVLQSDSAEYKVTLSDEGRSY
jgi:hypothetical protein